MMGLALDSVIFFKPVKITSAGHQESRKRHFTGFFGAEKKWFIFVVITSLLLHVLYY